jgi:hypothetical protein
MIDRNLDQLLDAWMDLGPTVAPARVAEAVRLEARSTRQTATLRGWPPRRFPVMNNTVRFALAAAVVAIAALLGYTYLAGPNVGGPEPEDPSPSAEVSAAAFPLFEQALEPGRYTLGAGLPVGVTFDLPSGWRSCSPSAEEQAVCRVAGRDAPGIGVAFLFVENVVADPCNGYDLVDPAVGSSVDELVTAISTLEGFDATAPEDVLVDGFAAKRFTISAPQEAPCDSLSTWATSTRTNGVGFGEQNLLHVVDVDGARILIASAYFDEQVTPEDFAAVEELVGSIDFER